VVCLDEKTAIQALDRLDPLLPLSPGRAERHGFEYYRHGTLSLFAAMDTATGAVVGKAARRHTSSLQVRSSSSGSSGVSEVTDGMCTIGSTPHAVLGNATMGRISFGTALV